MDSNALATIPGLPESVAIESSYRALAAAWHHRRWQRVEMLEMMLAQMTGLPLVDVHDEGWRRFVISHGKIR